MSRVDDYHRCGVLRQKLPTRRITVSGGLFRSTFTSIKAIRYRWKSIYKKNLLQVLTTNAHPGIVNIFSGTIPFPSGRQCKKKQNQREPKASNMFVKMIILEDI